MDQRIDELESENERLREEMNRLEAQLDHERKKSERAARIRTRAGVMAKNLLARVLFGSRLVGSIRAWLEATSARNPLPINETAELAAAILTRVIRVGAIGLIFAIIPGIITIGVATWQGMLMRAANSKIQLQFEQQITDSLLLHRGRFLEKIYGEDCHFSESTISCQLRAHPRVRASALRDFIDTERRLMILLSWGKYNAFTPSLKGANLGGLDLSNMDLSSVDFTQAIFDETDLRGTSFNSSYLISVDLSKSKNLTQSQIEEAIGNKATQLPPGLARPKRWVSTVEY